MNRSPVKAVSIAAGREQPVLSKGQKRFNTLIKQIEQKRARLAAWEAALPPYQQKYVGELLPLVDASTALQVEMVHALDRAASRKDLTKTERRTIAGLIADLARELLEESDDKDLKAIYNKHSRSDYDSEVAANMESMKFMLEDMLGVELGDDLDMNSRDDLFSRAEVHLEERRAQHEADRQAREERRAKRKKSDKQLAREAQQQAEAQQISQSIREVYRKLASALHPDRESDPQERARKTALMQRVNEAYGKNNLLQLLELQLELEHIDQSAIDGLSEERLTHYNAVLKEQLAELEQEILHVEGSFRGQFGLAPFDKVSPGTILRDLDRDIAGLRRAVRDMKRDLLMFDDIKTVKLWIKELRSHPPVSGFDPLF